MAVLAGFAEVDITPPLGTHKIGWLKDIVIDTVLDPLFARAVVLETGATKLAMVQLDTLSIRWTQTQEIRQRVQRRCGIPGANVLVAATHNHAGPAVANCGDVARDETYVESLVRKVEDCVAAARSHLQEAEIGFARVQEFGLSHNRRTVMRDGRTVTHCPLPNAEALFVEGPIDPEVGILAARSTASGGGWLGAIVNFACHPVHHGGGTAVTAGFPGALARSLQDNGCPHCVFLNGACGNISPGDPRHGRNPEMDELGARLAEDVLRGMQGMRFERDLPLGAHQTTVSLPYRHPSRAQVSGRARGAQRFIDSAIYDRGMPALVARIRDRRAQPAEVQTLRVGDVVYVSVPAEYFVEHALRIKERAYPLYAQVVSHANGMVGYVPTRQAFRRGGYETTFAGSSRLAPAAGDALADAAIALIRNSRT